MISEGLYDRGYFIKYSDDEIALYRTAISYSPSTLDVYHTIVDGEDLLSIARSRYGYSSLWFMIADVNPEIEDIFELTIGDSILIPDISLIQSNYARS